MRNFFSAKTVSIMTAALLFATTAQGAWAATISDSGAADLKKQVEQEMAFTVNMAKVTGTGVSMTGDIAVVPKGDYYEVRLPGLAYGHGFAKVNIGTLVMNVSPGDAGQYEMSIAVPSPLVVVDAGGKPLVEVTLGKQRLSGTWWPKYSSFTRVDCEYSDVGLRTLADTDNLTGTIGSLKSTMNLTQNADQSWSGPTEFLISNFKLAGGDKAKLDLTIDKIGAKASVDNMNLQAKKDLQEKVEKLLSDSLANQQPNPEQSRSLINNLLASLESYMDGMGSHVGISNLALTMTPDPATPPGPDGKKEEPLVVKVGSMESGFDVKGMKQPKGNLALKISFAGLSFSDVGLDVPGVIPTETNLEINLENLPMKELGSAFGTVISQGVQAASSAASSADPTEKQALDQQAKAQIMMAAASIPMQLATAGSTISVRNTYAKAPDITSTLDGSFAANPASPVMASGAITLLLVGIDELLQKVQGMAQAPGANPSMMMWVQAVATLQKQGELGKADDGRSQRSYKIVVGQDGKIMLNGQDLFSSMGMPR
ncbi:MAG: hypothetical protein ACAH80_12670 [Alphaproteobacteria bacterium]